MLSQSQIAPYLEKQGFLFIAEAELCICFMNIKYYTYHEFFLVENSTLNIRQHFTIEELEAWTKKQNDWINKLITHQQNYLC